MQEGSAVHPQMLDDVGEHTVLPVIEEASEALWEAVSGGQPLSP